MEDQTFAASSSLDFTCSVLYHLLKKEEDRAEFLRLVSLAQGVRTASGRAGFLAKWEAHWEGCQGLYQAYLDGKALAKASSSEGKTTKVSSSEEKAPAKAASEVTCAGTTKSGSPCRFKPQAGSKYCKLHEPTGH